MEWQRTFDKKSFHFYSTLFFWLRERGPPSHIFEYILLYVAVVLVVGQVRASEWLISRLGDGWLCSDLSSLANMVGNGKIDTLIRKVSSFAQW